MDKNAFFNADFYVAVITVIPVFYLTLTIQGSFFRVLVRRMLDYAKSVESGSPVSRGSRTLANLALGTALTILVYAVIGEWVAVLTLGTRNANSALENFVGGALLGLLCMTVAGPLAEFGQAYRRFWGAEFPHDAREPPDAPVRPGGRR